MSFQLGAGIDCHFARWTVELFFVALCLLCLVRLPRLVLPTRGASLRVNARGWTRGQAAPFHRWPLWGRIRKLRAGGGLWGQLRRAEQGIHGRRLWGSSGSQWTPLGVFSLLLWRLRRRAWAWGQRDKQTLHYNMMFILISYLNKDKRLLMQSEILYYFDDDSICRQINSTITNLNILTKPPFNQ